MRYQEEMLCAGDPLYALGPSMRRPAGPPQHDGYRAVQGTQLVMYGGATEDEELLLTNKTEEQLVANLRTGFVVGAVLAGVGALGALGTALVVLAMLAASVL
jgi:hypothetical protein